MVIRTEPMEAKSSTTKEKTNTSSNADNEAKRVEKMTGHPLPSILNLLTPSKISFRDGGSRSNSSSSSGSYGGTRRLSASPDSHKSSPIPLKYSPTLSATSPTLARSSPVNVAANRYQSQSPLFVKKQSILNAIPTVAWMSPFHP